MIRSSRLVQLLRVSVPSPMHAFVTRVPATLVRTVNGAALLLLAACSAAGDGITAPGPTTPSGPGAAALIDVSVPAVALSGVGSTETISATIRDASGRTLASPNVTWTSENPTVAEVAGSGTSAAIVARAPGSTRVRASSGNAAAFVDVRVLGVKAIVLAPASLGVRVGDVQPLRATVDGDAGASQAVRWAVLNPSIATVDASGFVTGVSVGTTTVRASASADPNIVATATVVVAPARTVSLAPGLSALTLWVGDAKTIQAELDVDSTQTRALVWTSENPSVATVDANGTITAVSVGSSLIRVAAIADPRAKDELLLTVLPARRVTVSPTALSVGVQQSASITATVVIDGGLSAAVVWGTSDASIVSVSPSGTVTGHRVGVATITATSAGDPTRSAIAVVTVTPSVLGVTVRPSAITEFVGDQDQLFADVVTDGPVPTTVTWHSSNPTVVSVSSSGLISSNSVGTATISAISTVDTTKRGTAQVTVQPAPSVGVSPSQATISIGEQRPLTGRITVAQGVSAALIWRTSDASIATVNANGVVTGVGMGTATITMLAAADTTKRATSSITVLGMVRSVVVTPANLSGFVGDVSPLTATVTADGSLSTAVSWRTSNTAVAIVSPLGNVTMNGLGQAIITAVSLADTTKRASALVTVNAPSVTGVSLTPTTATLFTGQTQQLTAVVTVAGALSNGYTLRSSNTNVATVGATGLVTAGAVGSSTITAIANADTTKRATATITVAAPGVGSIAVSPTSASLLVGQTQQLNTVVIASGGLSTAYTLRTSNSAVATVNATGLVTATGAGTSTITAIANADTTKRATATITVAAPTVGSVTVTPTSASLLIGQTQQLNTVVTANGGLPTTYTLRTSNSAVATVNATGLVTAVGAGSSTITAIATADTTKRATATITVTARPIVVSLSPRPVSLSVGQTQQLNAAVSADPGVSTAVTWTSSAGAVATVSASGLVNAVTSGSTLITATSVADASKKDTVTVTVASSQLATSWAASRLGGALYEDVISTIGFGANSAFAVNVVGDVFRWDGSSWSVAARGSTYGGQFLAVHGSSASDVIAVGTNGIIARFNGGSWSGMSSGTTQALMDVWSDGVGSAIAVGANGTALRLSGGGWSATATGTTQQLNAIWTSGGVSFAVGVAGTVLRYNGSSWSPLSTPTAETLYGVSGTSTTNVVAVGTVGTVLRFDGTNWTLVNNSLTSSDLYSVDGTSASGGRMYIASDAGLLQLDASTLSLPSTPYRPRVYAVSADAAGNLYATGQRGIVMRLAGGAWSTINLAPDLLDVWSTSSSNAFAVGELGSVYRFSSGTWTRQSTPTTVTLNTVWAPSATDAFAGGENGTLLRFNGSSWSAMSFPSTATVTALWGTSSNDVYAATSGGQVIRYNGTSWFVSATFAAPLWGIYGIPSGEVYATGESGTLMRFNGSGWTTASPINSGTFIGIWGTTSSNLLTVGADAAGAAGVAYRFNGSSWTSQSVGTTRVLTSAWGPSVSDLYVTGDQGTMLRYNGTSWQTMSTGTTDLLWSMTGSPNGAGGAFAVGYNSTLVTGNGSGPYVAGASRSMVRTGLDPQPAARAVSRATAPLPDGAARRQRHMGSSAARATSNARTAIPSVKFRVGRSR